MGEQKVLWEFRRVIEKVRAAVRLEVAVPTRSGPLAKVRRLGQRAGGINHKLPMGLPVDR